jgi:hypothetical protein
MLLAGTATNTDTTESRSASAWPHPTRAEARSAEAALIGFPHRPHPAHSDKPSPGLCIDLSSGRALLPTLRRSLGDVLALPELSRIGLSAASGYGYHGRLYFHLRCACAFRRFIFQPIAFRFCLLQHYLLAVPSVFLAVDLPGRSVFTEYNMVLFLRSVLLLYGTLPAFQLSCSPEYCAKLASRFFSVP